jgi:ribosomal protein L11 methyltransferase
MAGAGGDPRELWIELQIEVAPEAAELVASAVSELTGGVEVRDASTIIRAGDGHALVVAQCAPELEAAVLAELDATCAAARAAGLPIDPVSVRRREAHEDEWRDVWKQYFRTTRVGRTFVVRPSWDPGGVADGDRVIDIDPGRAFGTGGHASTRLAIELAEEIEERMVARFLDLGCGSGILSIAAIRLWPASSGLAVDVDPEAAACAAENLARNGIGAVRTRAGTLADLTAPIDPAARYDLVLANIQADVLAALSYELPPYLAGGAAVILSGLLQADAPAVLRAYRVAGLVLGARRDEDEWTALRLDFPGSAARRP